MKGFEAPEVTSRTYCYSPDGRLFAYVLPSWSVPRPCIAVIAAEIWPTNFSVRIHYAESAELLRELELPNIVEISFSPRGTYISTWERLGMQIMHWVSFLFSLIHPVKVENDAQHKNLRVFSVSTGEELAAFTQKAQGGWE